MSEFTTIYHKDYVWPPPKSYFPRNDLNCTIAVPATPENLQKDCPRFFKPEDDTTRPVVAKLTACPKAENVEYSDTDSCLKKLLEKNPNLFGIMQKLPSMDAIKKFNADRLRTTYQIDYDHLRDEAIDFSLLPKKGVSCPMDAQEPEVLDCRPKIRSRAELLKMKSGQACEASKHCKRKVKSNIKRKPNFDKSDRPKFLLKAMQPWSSEYRDGIDDSGKKIMKEMKIGRKKFALMQRRKELLNPQWNDY